MSETKIDLGSIIATEKEALEGMLATIKVDSPESYDLMQEGIERSYKFDKQVHDFLDPDVKNAHTTWDGLTSKRKRLLDMSKAARNAMGDAAIAYEEKLAKEAAQAAPAEQAEAKQKEEDHQIERAIAHDDLGMPNLADEILEEPIEIPAAKPLVTLTKRPGLGTVTRWKVKEVHDLPALIKDIAADPDLSYLLKPDVAALNKLASALKGHVKLSGITFEEDKKKQRTGTRR